MNMADKVKFWWRRDPGAFSRAGRVQLPRRFDWFDVWVGKVEGWTVRFYVFSGAILGASVHVTPPDVGKSDTPK